jgi:hypothetical protein
VGLETKLNPEQFAVYEAVGNYQSLVIEALAGTGKTTTLIACAEKIAKQNKRVLYLAFNKAIVSETKQKALGRFDCFTAHSLALQNVSPEHSGKFQRTHDRFLKAGEIINALKISGIECPDIEKPADQALSMLIEHQVESSRKTTVGSDSWRFVHQSILLDTIENTYDLFVRSAAFDLNHEFVERNMQLALPYPWCEKSLNFVMSKTLIDYVYTKCSDYWNQTIDTAKDDFPLGHDDYLKIWQLSKPMLSYDLILFDEAQDADRVMVDVVERQPSQVVWCGDSQQQIYGWRGAINILNSVRADKRLEIKTTQRFGRPIDQVANAFLIPLGDLRIEPNADKSGEYRFESPETTSVTETGKNVVVEPVQLELFRGNVPLLLRFAELVECDYGVNVIADLDKFQDLIEGLIAKFQDRPCPMPFLARFETFGELVDYMNHLNRKKTSRKPNWYPEVLSLFNLEIDSNNGVFHVMELRKGLCPRWDRLLQATKRARLTNEIAPITLATGHKAKGLTREVVRVSPDFVDHSLYNQPRTTAEAKKRLNEPTSEKNEAFREHQRLCYVAVTRASKLLIHPFHIQDIEESARFQVDESRTRKQTLMNKDDSVPSWVNAIYTELGEFNISWSEVISKQYRYRLSGWTDEDGPLLQIKIDLTVKKDNRPSSVEINDPHWKHLIPRLEKVLRLQDKKTNRPEITSKTRTDLKLVMSHANAVKHRVEWLEADADYQIQIKSSDLDAEVWLFFGKHGLNTKVPAKSFGESQNVNQLLQIIKESLS